MRIADIFTLGHAHDHGDDHDGHRDDRGNQALDESDLAVLEVLRSSTIGNALDQRALSGSRSPHSHAGLIAERNVLSCR